MNIFIGKVGKAVFFDENRWMGLGGDVEFPTFVYTLAKNNPDDIFYLAARSDYSQIGHHKFMLPNIFDVWECFDKSSDEIKSYIWEILKDVKMDFGYVFGGPVGRANVPGYTPKASDGEWTKPLGMLINYSAPIMFYVNASNVPYFWIATDSRFFPQKCVDFINLPQFAYGQYTFTGTWRHMKALEPISDRSIILTSMVSSEYARVETMFLNSVVKPTFDEYMNERSIPFDIILNFGGNGALERYDIIYSWVLDFPEFADTKVYGKWPSELVSGDEHFPGTIPYTELPNYLSEVKYTFIVPIQRGWSTMKFWEMIHFGIVPFLHPWYDEQQNIKEIPEILRVRTPLEMVERVKLLDSDEKLYRSVKKQLYDLLDDKYYNGQWLQKILKHSKLYIKNLNDGK